MKRLFMTVMVVLTFVAAASAITSKEEKEARKFAKKQAKEWTAEGWKVDGMYTIEEVLYQFRIEMLKDTNSRQHTGVVEGETTCKTVNQAKQWASVNAANTYAQEAEMMIQNKIVGDIAVSIEGASYDNFFSAYKAMVQKEIKGELKMKFGVYRIKKNGVVEYRAYYIINEPRAASVRQRALMNAINEANILREHAEELSDFVGEPSEK